jgi:hypothetical protein
MLVIAGLDVIVLIAARSLRIDRIKEILAEHGIDTHNDKYNTLSMIGEN